MQSLRSHFPAQRTWLAALTVAVVALGVRGVCPEIELDFFARFSAQLAAWFSGTSLTRESLGWAFLHKGLPVLVTRDCSASDFALLAAMIVAWNPPTRPSSFLAAVAWGLLGGVLIALLVNALRVLAIMELYRWVIPQVPGSYEKILHLLVGTAVFLPALLLLHSALHVYGTRSRPTPHVPPA